MKAAWEEYQNLVLSLLDQHDNKLSQVEEAVKDLELDGVKLDSSVTSLKADTEKIKNILRDGSNSIFYRIQSLESRFQELDNHQKNDDNQKIELQVFKKGMIIAILSAILSPIVMAFLTHFFK